MLVHWQKPAKNKKSSYSLEDREKLPEKLLLRQIKVTINSSGFRTSSFYIITSLLDADRYPAADMADLYFQRWDVELVFRDIKITMAMYILRCQSPDMVRKEILMHLIAYNCIRRLMMESIKEAGVAVRRISFKGCVQALRQWEPHLNQTKMSAQERHRLLGLLYDSIAEYTVAERSGRSEQKAVKRRPKPFQLLTAPRHEMKETKHRGKTYGKQA